MSIANVRIWVLLFRSDDEPYGRKNFHWTDPNISAAEVQWLRADLKKSTKKTVVFAHQRLDVRVADEFTELPYHSPAVRLPKADDLFHQWVLI